jgi:biopolymer transport protein ExbD
MKKSRKMVSAEAELDLKPMMNLFSILIPYLLMCASFASVRLIEINLPETRLMVPQQQQTKDKEDEGLLLTIFMTDEGITLGARGAMLPTTFTKEVHKYVYNWPKGTDKKQTYLHFVTKQNKNELPACPKDPGRRLTLFEREEIILYAVRKENEADSGAVAMAVYDAANGAVTNVAGRILEVVPHPGDTVYPLSLEDRRMHIVKPEEKYHVQQLTVYDELASRLIRIKAQYPMVPDRDEIKLVAEDDVVYDKLVHVMDVCRIFGFPKIALAKLSG